MFLSEPIGTVDTRLERLHAFKQTMAQYSGLLAEQAETPLSDPQQLEQVLSGFSGRHRGLRKAVISANGALTLQVARAGWASSGAAISACWASMSWNGPNWRALASSR